MYIEKIRIKNFKSIGGKWQEIVIGNEGLSLIQGSNGTGKSTLFHAITYGLFNKNSHTKGRSKTSIPTKELINDITKKEMLVEITLPTHIIKRGLAPDVFEIIDRKTNKNLVESSSKTIDQKYLEENILNGLNYDIYTKIVSLNAKASSTPFLYMSPSERKEFLEYLLDLRLVYFVNEVLKSKLSDIKLDIRDSESKLDNAKSLVKAEEYKLEQDTIKLEEQKAKIDKLKSQKQEMIDDIQESIDNKKKEISELDILEDKSKIKEKLKDYKNKKAKVEVKLKEIEKSKHNTNRELYKLDTAKEAHEENLKGFELCGTCPTVEKIVGKFSVKEYEKSKEELNKKLAELDTNTDKVNLFMEKIEPLITETDELIDTYEYNDREFKRLQESIKQDEVKIEKLSNFDDMELFEIDETRLKELEEALNTVENKHDYNINKKEQIERVRKRVGDKSIKEEVLSYYQPLLENKINELLDKFFEDDSFTFSITLDESFNIEGYKNGKKSNIFKLSEGQLGSVSIAFTLAFQYLLSLKNNINFKLFLIDEILDTAFDSNRLDKIIEYIKEISLNKAVILISHNKSLNLEYFDRVIETKKVNHFTEYKI